MVNENKYIINRKCIMLQKGHTLNSLAEHVGHTKQAVSQSILCKSTSLRIHRKIVDLLGVSLVEFWPELYGEINGTDKSADSNISHDATVSEQTGVVN